MQEINFIKAVASGNDFVIINRLKIRPASRAQERRGSGSKYRVNNSQLAKLLCQRKLSVGADGLLVVEPSKKADLKMRVFNPDGTEVDMCGNGSRCVALYAERNKICGKKMVIETRSGNLEAEVEQDRVKIKMAPPKGLWLGFSLDIKGRTKKLDFINTGVPHVVYFVQALGKTKVAEIGRAIRYHPEFKPQGTNVDFVEVLSGRHIRVRTYERGVEQETLACGTGCVAAAIITAYRMEQTKGRYKVNVDTQSGETLTVYFDISGDNAQQVFLEGKAKIVYRGTLGG